MMFKMKIGIILVLASVFCVIKSAAGVNRSFIVDYKNNCFLKDGKPFRYISSSLHYFRVPRYYWADRMSKYEILGINAIETYIEWSQHEPEPRKYNFEGQLNVFEFFRMAQQKGFVVILRPGPYIDAERDFGGFPYWLLKDKQMQLRSSDPSYMETVTKWYNVLLPRIKPYLYENGGPIISVQVENEYGSYFTHDKIYTQQLRDLIRRNLGNKILLFTTDGDGTGYLKYGTIPEVYATVDFGSGTNVPQAIKVFRQYTPRGPFVNSEYYPGWLDHWAHPHANVPSQKVATTLDQMLSLNASVNIYTAHGGTSFGFQSGSNGNADSFTPCPTSYDYDAPISEAGDVTPKYKVIRDVIKKYFKVPDVPLPQIDPKMEVGPLQMTKVASLMESLKNITPVFSKSPKTFEDLGQAYGYVMYSTIIKTQHNDPEYLNVSGIRDRGYIFVDYKLKGIVSRGEKVFTAPISIAKGQMLSIVVENQGRICYGSSLADRKGLLSPVFLGREQLMDWQMVKVPLTDDWLSSTLDKLSVNEVCQSNSPAEVPAFYTSNFLLPKSMPSYPLDTFLRVDGWHKGVAFLNGFNLGRYWPVVGPQITLYAPKNLFKPYPQINRLVLLEFEGTPCQNPQNCVAKFVKVHVVNGPTPNL